MGYTERVTWKHILPYVKQTANVTCSGNSNKNSGNSTTTGRGGVGWVAGGRFRREVQEGEDTPMVDSCLCLAETNTIL